METILNNQKEQVNLPKEKAESKRSSSYPALTITEAFNFACKINNNFSTTHSVTRNEIAKSLELKNPNSISREVAACSQYGLFSKETDGYKLTELFTDILRPESETHKKIDLIKAFGSPKLNQELIKKFDNQTIPQELTNTLIKHHGITENASKDATSIFLSSAKEVGVLSDSRLLQYEVTLSFLSKSNGYTQIIDEEDLQQESENKNSSLIQVNSSDFIDIGIEDKRIPIHLTKNKIAYLVYPNNVTSQDIELIKHQLEGILLRLKFEKEEEIKKPTI